MTRAAQGCTAQPPRGDTQRRDIDALFCSASAWWLAGDKPAGQQEERATRPDDDCRGAIEASPAFFRLSHTFAPVLRAHAETPKRQSAAAQLAFPLSLAFKLCGRSSPWPFASPRLPASSQQSLCSCSATARSSGAPATSRTSASRSQPASAAGAAALHREAQTTEEFLERQAAL